MSLESLGKRVRKFLVGVGSEVNFIGGGKTETLSNYVLSHSLENLSSERARPMYSAENRVSGTEDQTLDKRLGFGTAS